MRELQSQGHQIRVRQLLVTNLRKCYTRLSVHIRVHMMYAVGIKG